MGKLIVGGRLFRRGATTCLLVILALFATACSGDAENGVSVRTQAAQTPAAATDDDALAIPPATATAVGSGQACRDELAGANAYLPSRPPASFFDERAEAALENYHDRGVDYAGNLQQYEPLGDYLNYGLVHTYEMGGRFAYDDNDIPVVEYDGVYQYNPLTVAQYGLTMYGRHLRGALDAERVIFIMDALLDLQGEDGAFRYDFPWYYYASEETFEPGWVSGLTQGVALSAMVRAYDMTGDERYREAGNRALEFMLVPVSEGGTMTTLADLATELDGYAFVSEYPSEPEFFTLNGFLFTMLGLYDWAEEFGDTEHGRIAQEYFDCFLETLELILPLFDAEQLSAYDLLHILSEGREPNLTPTYHAIHIHQLHALESVTGNEVMKEWEMRWRSYVDDGRSQAEGR